MGKFRKKPIIVEAEVWCAGMEDGVECRADRCLKRSPSNCFFTKGFECPSLVPFILTLEGKMYISEGDYIITGIRGERYPCKPDIFEMTYEKAE